MVPVKKKKVLKEEDILDQAIAQQQQQPAAAAATTPAAAPQPTLPQGTPAVAPQAAASTLNPLIPPAPGMIPTGWMYPQQGAVAAAMDTGDVNVAATAPDAAPIEPSTEPAGDSDLTAEEKDVLAEYRKWKAQKTKMKELNKKLGSKISEDVAEENVIPPAMPKKVDLVEPPIAADEELDATMPLETLSGDEVDEELPSEEEEGESVLEELGDIVIDVNSLFSDLGGDLDELLSDDDEDIEGEELDVEEDVEEGDVEEEDDVEGEEEAPADEELMERRALLARRVAEFKARQQHKQEEVAVQPIKKQIKYPAGSGASASAMKELESKHLRRRAALAELRKNRAALQEEGAGQPKEADPDKLDDEIGYDSVTSVVDKLGESAIKTSVRKSLDKKFQERYEEKKGLNFKRLLEKGLLG